MDGALTCRGFAVLLFLTEGTLAAAGVGVAYLARRENLLAALRPELPWTMILGTGATAGVLGALLVLGLYRSSPAYRRGVGPVVDLLRRLPRGWLWAAVLVAPLGEEFFFRGALQPLIGLFWTALIFGLLHTGFRRTHLAYGLTAAVVGLLLGLSYQFLGELWAPIVAHAAYNALVVAALPRFPVSTHERTLPKRDGSLT